MFYAKYCVLVYEHANIKLLESQCLITSTLMKIRPEQVDKKQPKPRFPGFRDLRAQTCLNQLSKQACLFPYFQQGP